MARPHKIDTTEMLEFFNHKEVEGASATTSDGTQRKTLLRRGGATYIVRRQYTAPSCGDNFGKVEPIYSGTNLEEAVRIYNGLS